MSRSASLIGFFLLVVGGGLLIGSLNVPGEWYEQLNKPVFNPPNWIFGPVWTVLYVLIAFAGWRLWKHDPKSPATLIWWLQLALNFLWPWVFFSAQRPHLALVIILLLLATILALIILTLRPDRPVALLVVPYAIWVAFASALNGSIFLLN